MSNWWTARTPAQERQRRKQRLAATMRLFAKMGFGEGGGGQVTVRDPVHLERFWINPVGLHFGRVRVSDLLLVNSDGTVLQGNGEVDPAGFAIHSQVHAARPEVVAAAHTHSVHGRAWSTLGRRLEPLTQDACAFYEDHEVYSSFGEVVLDLDEGKRIAERLGGGKAVILQNHGLLTVGSSVQEAAWWFISMERSCQVQLLAEAAGTPLPIEPAAARHNRATMGTPAMGRLNFRPLFNSIIEEQLDLLD